MWGLSTLQSWLVGEAAVQQQYGFIKNKSTDLSWTHKIILFCLFNLVFRSSDKPVAPVVHGWLIGETVKQQYGYIRNQVKLGLFIFRQSKTRLNPYTLEAFFSLIWPQNETKNHGRYADIVWRVLASLWQIILTPFFSSSFWNQGSEAQLIGYFFG